MRYAILEKMFEGENPQSVFEVGCANGGLLYDLYESKGVAVGGMDRHAGDLEKSKNLFPKYTDNFFVYNASDIHWPVQDNEYDIVCTIGTLMYIENPIPVLREMLRIGKKVIIAEPETGEIVHDHHGQRFYRNYETLLRELGAPYEACGVENGKSIFKCKKIH